MSPVRNRAVRRGLLPFWLVMTLDAGLIAGYVGSFYGLYYLSARSLLSEGTYTTISSTSIAAADTSAEEIASIDTGSSVDTFSDTVLTTGTSYVSADLSITVKTYTTGSGVDTVTYYVADIYLTDVTLLRSGFANNTYGIGYTEHVLAMDDEFDALLAVNGDYYGNGSSGVVIRNGQVYRSTTDGSDVCVLYSDGRIATYSGDGFDVSEAVADGAWQAWSFGPSLLDGDGNALTSFSVNGHVSDYNPRTAIGYYEPGHYCLVVVDGRDTGYSKGVTLTELASLMQGLGCTSAYNLDGGESSEMTFDDAYVNQPANGGRAVSDCIYLTEG